MKRLFYISAAAAAALLLARCGEKNDMVLGIDDMASLMADIHIAEAVVDLNHNEFGDDSSKMVLKQSIYAAHGVTPQQVDSSYAWYGYHVEDYMKVYDKTIEILKSRQDELLAASDEQIAIAGDSVNVWPLSSHFEFSRRSPSRLITFSIPVDSNWRNNDVFALRYKMVSARKPITARLIVEYADGTSAYNIAAGKSNGSDELLVRVDSTRSPQRIAGYIIATPDGDETVSLDSIALVRQRSYLVKKFFSQRQFNFGIAGNNKLKHDTAEVANSSSDSIPVFPGSPAQQAPASTTVPAVAPPSMQGGHRAAAAGQVAKPPKGSGESAAQQAVRERDAMLRAAQQRSRKKR